MLQKGLTWATAVIENLFFAGIVFGWASLYPVLVEENFFSENCEHLNISANVTLPPCESQKQALAFVFVLSTSLGLFSSVFVGVALDHFGIWSVRTVLINLAVVSLLVTAHVSSEYSYALCATVSVLHISGLGLHITNLQISNLFPQNRNMYVAFISGALGSGSATFLILNHLYFQLETSFKVLFTAFASLYFLLNLRTFFLTPRFCAPENIPTDYTYGYKQIKDVPSNRSDYQMVRPKKDEKTQLLECHSFKQFVTKRVYIYTVLSNTVLNFTSMLYISVFNDFMVSLLKQNEQQVDFYVNIFGVIQFVGFIFSPLSGAITQYHKHRSTEDDHTASIRSCAIGLFIGGFCAVAMELCMIFPSAELQLVSMTMQVLSKAFFVSSSNTFISLIFPAKIFGKLYSVMAVCQATMLLLQQPLTLLLHEVLRDNFVIFNSLICAVSVLTMAQPIYVVFFYLRGESKHYDKKNEESLLLR